MRMKMNKKIICKHIKKSYGSQIIFEDFSYGFNSEGLYVLFGSSGSGKTTLLNILYGTTEYDGSVIINNIEYKNQVDYNKNIDEMVYIPQDEYFIDYLNVIDNLRLCSEDLIKIDNLLDKFKLFKSKDTFPKDLSGGEKKRLSLLIAVLKNKKILLLDEPTSSLDLENRQIIIDLIYSMKSEILIICSTHDEKFKEIADDVIDFKYLEKYESKEIDFKNFNYKSYGTENNHNLIPCNNLYPFVKKERLYERRDNKSKKIFVSIMFLTLLVSFLCYSPKQKLMDMIENDYKINNLMVYCPTTFENNCKNTFANNNIIDVVYQYNKNLGEPYEKDYYVDGMNLQAISLPFEKEALNLDSIIKYGDYFKSYDQIILGYNLALQYDSNPENLVGKKLPITLIDGETIFEIAGIFREFNNVEKRYFEIMLEYDVDSMIFLNSKYTEKYLTLDNSIYKIEKNFNKNSFVVYFNSFKNLYSFYQKYEKNDIRSEELISVQKFDESFVNLYMTFQDISIILYPLATVSLLLSILFYFNMKKAELDNRKYIFSVYNYYGYTYKQVKKAYGKFYLLEILKLFLYSLIGSIIFSLLFNMINKKFIFINFKLFTINIQTIIIILTLIMSISLALLSYIFMKVRTIGWYKNLQENRDLL